MSIDSTPLLLVRRLAMRDTSRPLTITATRLRWYVPLHPEICSSTASSTSTVGVAGRITDRATLSLRPLSLTLTVVSLLAPASTECVTTEPVAMRSGDVNTNGVMPTLNALPVNSAVLIRGMPLLTSPTTPTGPSLIRLMSLPYSVSGVSRPPPGMGVVSS